MRRRWPERRPRAGSGGAALMLALWLLLLMSGLIAVFALSARTEGLQASALRQAAGGRYAAEAGIELAALHLLTPDQSRRWVADARPYRFMLDDWTVEVRVRDESGKFDLNTVPSEPLARLLVVLGTDPQRAAAIADAVVDWRDADDLISTHGAEDGEYAAAGLSYGSKDQPFVAVSELQQVLGMDNTLYQRAAPHLTVYTGEATPRLFAASSEVLQALGYASAAVDEIQSTRAAWQPGMPATQLADGSPLAGDGSGTYSIYSRALRRSGAALEVTAIVRAGNSGRFGQLYTPLAWWLGDPD